MGQERQREPFNERGTRANSKSLFFGEATALKIRQAEQEEARDARQLRPFSGQTNTFAVPLDEFTLEKIFQLLDLAAVLTLLHRIATGGFDDAAGCANFQQRPHAIEGKAVLSE